MTFSLPTESIPAALAYVRLLILRADDPRRSSRLLLDFLDARTEHEALRLSDAELRSELERIGAEAQTSPSHA